MSYRFENTLGKFTYTVNIELDRFVENIIFKKKKIQTNTKIILLF